MAMFDWIAERISGEKVKNGIRYFLVEWDSGHSKRTTYEAESDLESCRSLISDFQASKAMIQRPTKPHSPASGSDAEHSPPPSPKQKDLRPRKPPVSAQISSVIGVRFERGQWRFAVCLTDGRTIDASRSELLTGNMAAYVAFLEQLACNS
jgi:hypothetical protein